MTQILFEAEMRVFLRLINLLVAIHADDTNDYPGSSDFHNVWAQGFLSQEVSPAVTPTLTADKSTRFSD